MKPDNNFTLKELESWLKKSPLLSDKEYAKNLFSYIVEKEISLNNKLPAGAWKILNPWIEKILQTYTLQELDGLSIKNSANPVKISKAFMLFHQQTREVLISDNILSKSYHDKESLWKFVLELQKHSLLNVEKLKWIKQEFNLSENKEKNTQLFSHTIAMQDLNLLDIAGFDIWQMVLNQSGKEVLFPINVYNKDSARKRSLGVFKKETIYSLISFLRRDKKIWQKIETNNTSKKELKTSIAMRLAVLSSEVQYRKTLKSLDIKDDDMVLNMSLSNKNYNVKEILLRYFKLTTLKNIANKNIYSNNQYEPIIQLIKALPGEEHEEALIMKRSAYWKIWQDTYKTIDFQTVKEGKNLINQLLDYSDSPMCYFPFVQTYYKNPDMIMTMSEAIEQNPPFLISYYAINYFKVLNFFKQNKVNFSHEYKGNLVWSDIIKASLKLKTSSDIEAAYSENGLMRELLCQIPQKEQSRVWSTVFDNWKEWFSSHPQNEKIRIELLKTFLQTYTQSFLEVIHTSFDEVIKDMEKYSLMDAQPIIQQIVATKQKQYLEKTILDKTKTTKVTKHKI